jgi:apolipoprotein N-acyltransferase
MCWKAATSPKLQGAPLRRRRPNIDRLAIWALVVGGLSLILFVFCLGFVLGPVAVVVGVVSLRKVKHGEGALRGGGTAAAGMVLGIAGLIASIAWWIHIQSLGGGGMFCVGPGGNLC